MISHLACAEEPEHPLNRRQQDRFAAVAARFPGVPASLAASSGIFLGRRYHFDLVRPGAALYGVNPLPGRPNPLRPVVRLAARIIQIREIDSGESVGYGAAHVMQAPGRVATVALGYADGWLRALSRRGCGFVGGKRVPLLGRVSMDLCAFDVSAVPPALTRPGMTIELLGPGYGVDDVAADAGTIGYEILTALGARYHRVYRDCGRCRMTRVSRVGRGGLPGLSRGDRPARPVRRRRRRRPVRAALLPPADPAPDRRYRLFLAAGGRADRAVHRHGAGAADLYRVQPLQRRERDRHRRRARRMTRELGPVIAGLMVAGRVGAAMAAEIGTMRVTEQIDALTTLSTDPLRYLVLPRLLAGSDHAAAVWCWSPTSSACSAAIWSASTSWTSTRSPT